VLLYAYQLVRQPAQLQRILMNIGMVYFFIVLPPTFLLQIFESERVTHYMKQHHQYRRFGNYFIDFIFSDEQFADPNVEQLRTNGCGFLVFCIVAVVLTPIAILFVTSLLFK
jgi:hypothetical protein